METALSLKELDAFLDEARQTGDDLADRVIKAHGRDRSFAKTLKRLSTNAELEHIGEFPAFQALIKEVQSSASGFDHQLMAAGQKVFRKYATDILPILGLYSLPYCYAAEEGSKVLILSKYLTEDPSKRLQETGEFVIEMGAPDAFSDTGSGLIAIIKVRLIHSYIRHHLSGQITHEVPVNQEDMLGTNLSFSLIVLRGLRKLGVEPSGPEQQAYMYMWWGIGRLLGIHPRLLPMEIKAASTLEATIRGRQFRVNEEGKRLTYALLKHFENFWTVPGLPAAEIMSFMLGEPVRRHVGLPPAGAVTTGAIQIAALRNFFRLFTEKNYAQIFRLADFDAFQTTPGDLKV